MISKSKKLIGLLFLMPYCAMAANIDVTKTTNLLDQIRDVLTSKILVGILTVVIVVVGYMYLFNKGNVAKEWLIAILVGSAFILSASGIAAIVG